MKLDLVDYHGPTGAYIATDRGALPLTDPEGMSELMDSTMLVSLRYTERAAEYERLVESAKARRASQAAVPS